jgi:hypothetical protein
MTDSHDAAPASPVAAPPDDRDPARWPAAALDALQAIIDRSRASAGAAVRDTFDRSERQLSAAEFAAFWNATRMKAMATARPATQSAGRAHDLGSARRRRDRLRQRP